MKKLLTLVIFSLMSVGAHAADQKSDISVKEMQVGQSLILAQNLAGTRTYTYVLCDFADSVDSTSKLLASFSANKQFNAPTGAITLSQGSTIMLHASFIESLNDSSIKLVCK